MNIKQIRNKLMEAFGCSSDEELKSHLIKTDLQSKAELLHAANVVWSYTSFYPGCCNRQAIREILESQPESLKQKLAYEAKYGFGSYAA